MEKEVKDIKFDIRKFDVIQFSTFKPVAKITKSSNIKFDMNSKYIIEKDKDEIHIYFIANININRKSTSKKLASIETVTTFQIKELSNYYINDDIALPIELLNVLFSVPYTMTRGALSALSHGTVPSYFLLPLVPPTKLIPESLINNISDN